MFENREFVGIHFSRFFSSASNSKKIYSGPLSKQSKGKLNYFWNIENFRLYFVLKMFLESQALQKYFTILKRSRILSRIGLYPKL